MGRFSEVPDPPGGIPSALFGTMERARVASRRGSKDRSSSPGTDPAALVLTPDWRDPADTQFMELCPLAVPGGYVATVTVFHNFTQTIDLQWAASRDGILGGLLFRALRGDERGWRMRWAVTAIALAACVAAADEWHQLYVPSRTGSAWDAVLDVVGAGQKTRSQHVLQRHVGRSGGDYVSLRLRQLRRGLCSGLGGRHSGGRVCVFIR